MRACSICRATDFWSSATWCCSVDFLAYGTPVVEVINLLGTGIVGKSRKIFALAGRCGFYIDAETRVDFWPMLESYFGQIVDSFTIGQLPSACRQR